ncbi:MAG: type I restriction-modification system subunit M [Candidatus Phytoplasma vitis]|nr:MAG: type I restriction-modification system subunit M [Candidatus Phytoplasma vitis]
MKKNIHDLKHDLWKIACDLRGHMDAFEFKDYILSILCFRFLSEKLENCLKNRGLGKFQEYKEEFDNDQETIKNMLIDELGFYLKPKELWSYLIKVIENNSNEFHYKLLSDAFVSIEETPINYKYKHVFSNLFSNIDLDNIERGSTTENKNTLLSRIILSINNLCPFNSYCNEYLGDIYEYLIGQFAASAGKKAGEFFTPSSVSNLIAKIVTSDSNKTKGKLTIYDPTCGSGSLLLKVFREIKNKNKDIANINNENNDIAIYGQELNNTTYNLARMNMLMHDIDYFNISIYNGDTLTDFGNKHPHRQIVSKKSGFDIIVANPPYSLTWCKEPNSKIILKDDERFSNCGKLAPKNKADWAFVQHMLYCLKEDGICAVVLPHGVLFRGKAEALIRKYILEQKYLDAVIGLPENIFYGMDHTTCILIFRKCQTNNNILFIDASKEYITQRTKNILSEKNIDNILQTYLKRENIANISFKASMEDIKKNDYILSINYYIKTETKTEEIDIISVQNRIKQLENEKKAVDKEIDNYLKELE